jgi:hypothetical protein
LASENDIPPRQCADDVGNKAPRRQVHLDVIRKLPLAITVMTLRHAPHGLIGFLRILVLVPFLGLSMLPQGVMPGRSADGTLTLTLCSGDGPVDVTIDLATGEPVAPGHGKVSQTCDWAMGQVAALVGDADAQSGPPLVLRPFDAPAETFAYTPAHDPRGLWARGPPSLI